jgi:RES domain-containing protein
MDRGCIKWAYRTVYKGFADNPIASRSAKGRFHEAPGTTSYFAESASTAWNEVNYRWQAQPDEYRLVEVALRVYKWLDLTNAKTQRKYKIDPAKLVDADHSYCQELAARLRAEGIEAVRTYSYADQPDGRNWVVFLECLGPQSSIVVQRVGPVPTEPPKASRSRKRSKSSARGTGSRKKM